MHDIQRDTRGSLSHQGIAVLCPGQLAHDLGFGDGLLEQFQRVLIEQSSLS